ncbi:hypothetical protein PC116_g31290 [Phytophthora cactorum]|nr:hypothetical protein PC116_g31290 [Phytophthora cactorum]
MPKSTLAIAPLPLCSTKSVPAAGAEVFRGGDTGRCCSGIVDGRASRPQALPMLIKAPRADPAGGEGGPGDGTPVEGLWTCSVLVSLFEVVGRLGLGNPSKLPCDGRMLWPDFLLNEFALISVAVSTPGGAGAFLCGKRSGFFSSNGETRGWSKSTFLPMIPVWGEFSWGDVSFSTCLRLARYAACCFSTSARYSLALAANSGSVGLEPAEMVLVLEEGGDEIDLVRPLR